MSEKKKVVVVGGGIAGSKACKELEGVVDVTLIDPDDSLLRALAASFHARKRWSSSSPGQIGTVKDLSSCYNMFYRDLAYVAQSFFSTTTPFLNNLFGESYLRVLLKNYFEIPYPEPRSIVEPSFADRTLIPYNAFLKDVKHVQNTAEEATATEVITASGERIPYDFLAITTGTTYSGPATKEERLKEFEDRNKKIVDAESVLIIGGGPVGVELAAEIVTDFPKKKVTLLSRGPQVLEFLGPKAGQKAEKWLKKKGVELILKDSIDVNDISPPEFQTKGQVTVKADTHVVAIGKKTASGWLAASEYLRDAVTENGQIKVEPTTQVVGFPNVFAAGDITDFKEIKQGYLAAQHADILAGNIKKLVKDPNDKKLLVYKPMEKPGGLVTLGRVESLLSLPFIAVVGWIPGKLKSKDFFVGKTRAELGLPK